MFLFFGPLLYILFYFFYQLHCLSVWHYLLYISEEFVFLMFSLILSELVPDAASMDSSFFRLLISPCIIILPGNICCCSMYQMLNICYISLSFSFIISSVIPFVWLFVCFFLS